MDGFLAGGFVTLVQEWLKSGMDTPASEPARMLTKLSCSAVAICQGSACVPLPPAKAGVLELPPVTHPVSVNIAAIIRTAKPKNTPCFFSSKEGVV
jgi:hypothetical protein